MEIEILYWHWVILGIGLILLELALPSFTALWFGAGALVVGLVLYLAPDLSLAVQVILWTVVSSILTWLWFKILKPLSADRTKAGLSREAIVGETGQVLSTPIEDRRGTLRFPAPILGSDEWLFISQETVAVGDRVRVTDVSGNTLIVTKA
jgi:membrane protein implicated in regulation of membrane protease activity